METGSEDRFARSIVEALAKRAALLCSNPDCGVLTAGPADDDTKPIIIGEAAHIYGAKPGSARFDPSMASVARSNITNGIWLCRNCHKQVDADPSGYPPELLFEWRRAHEMEVSSRLGKQSSLLREKVINQKIKIFENESYLAQQIVIDKPDFWEYRLTIELLTVKLSPIISRWRSLRMGLYSKPILRVPSAESFEWFQDRIHEASMMPESISGVAQEFEIGWGPKGVAGSETEILRVCSLFAEFCQTFLDWEERVRFVRLSEDYKPLQSALLGTAGGFIDQVANVPIQLAAPLADENATGTYEISIMIALPPDWVDNAQAALKTVENNVVRRLRQ